MATTILFYTAVMAVLSVFAVRCENKLVILPVIVGWVALVAGVYFNLPVRWMNVGVLPAVCVILFFIIPTAEVAEEC